MAAVLDSADRECSHQQVEFFITNYRLQLQLLPWTRCLYPISSTRKFPDTLNLRPKGTSLTSIPPADPPPLPCPLHISTRGLYLTCLSQKLLKHPWLFRLTHVFSLSADPVSSTSKCIQNLTTSHQQATLRPPTFPPPLGSAVAASPHSASTLVQILYRSATWEALSVFSEGVLRLCSQLAHSFLPHSRKARIYPMA